MSNRYADTIQFWNKTFGEYILYNPTEKIMPELEKAVAWLAAGQSSVLDFGAGSGRFLLRCLNYGVGFVKGIDISESAVRVARQIATNYQLSDKTEFICGGIEELAKIEPNTFDSCVLSNIVDNLAPDDAEKLLAEIRRIVHPKGRVLLKFNPYIEKEKRMEYGFVELSANFYRETSGIFLYNLTNQQLEEMISVHFQIEQYKTVYYQQHDLINRLYYVLNKEK